MMKMMKWRIEVPEGEMFPSTHGVAWRPYDRNVTIAYPIPFNILYRLWMQFRIWLFRGCFRSKYEMEQYRNFHRGWDEGYHKGLECGESQLRNKLKKLAGEDLHQVFEEIISH